MKIELINFLMGSVLNIIPAGFPPKKKKKGPVQMADGGLRGVRITRSRTEIRKNTAQNNTRKQQTALKLSENS